MTELTAMAAMRLRPTRQLPHTVRTYLLDGRPDPTLNADGRIRIDLDSCYAPHRLKAAPSTMPVALAFDPPQTPREDRTLLTGGAVELENLPGQPLNAVIKRFRANGAGDPPGSARDGTIRMWPPCLFRATARW
jgi:hypothetical protein